MARTTSNLLAGIVLATLAVSARGGAGDTAPLPVPEDRAYPGEIQVAVDAADIDRHIIHVHESISGLAANAVLLYPQWIPGEHAPTGPIDQFSGLKITAAGKAVAWKRDPVQMYAFWLQPQSPVSSVELEFDYLSPTSAKVGKPEIGPDLLVLDWNKVVLYPAGYYARQIPVAAQLTVPAGWTLATALEPAGTESARGRFKTVSLETLVDSPVYAGRYAARVDLDPGGAAPVQLNLFADRPELLKLADPQLAAYRALVQQAYKLFGSHHYAHYDFLYSLSDEVDHKGLEHHQSSEDGSDPEALTKWDENAEDRDLLAHEYTHSWNGKFRRPADLWTPNYNVPMRDSLLWVYEGQTQYWGQVLAARSGLWSKQQFLDALALTAAAFQNQSGRRWRALEDTTNDEIINPRRPQSWNSWQRFEDYYDEGKLIWLDADTLIRERSKGRRSLDDFAHQFFGINNGSVTPVTYTFEAVVAALNAVEPYDWAGFLNQRLNFPAQPVPLDGFRRGGYKLVYTDQPNSLQKTADEHDKTVSLDYSIGVQIQDRSEKSDVDGSLAYVLWDGVAYKAGLTEGAQILAVNGRGYSADVLLTAIRAAKDGAQPIELIVKSGPRFEVVKLDYHDGLRYPHLERDAALPARLDDIAAARH